MRAFIEKIELYPQKRKDGCWIKSISFNFPVPLNGQEVTELPLENETTIETVVTLSRKIPDEAAEVDLDLDEPEAAAAESKAT